MNRRVAARTAICGLENKWILFKAKKARGELSRRLELLIVPFRVNGVARGEGWWEGSAVDSGVPRGTQYSIRAIIPKVD